MGDKKMERGRCLGGPSGRQGPVRFRNLAVGLVLLASGAALGDEPLKGGKLLPSDYQCDRCDLTFMKEAIPVPKRGIVFAMGSFLSPGADWKIFDQDARTLSVVTTQIESDQAGDRHLKLVSQHSVRLTQAQMDRIGAIADRIWGSRDRMPGEMATDISWDLYLIDQPSIRHEGGMVGLPGGTARELTDLFDQVLKAHE